MANPSQARSPLRTPGLDLRWHTLTVALRRPAAPEDPRGAVHQSQLLDTLYPNLHSGSAGRPPGRLLARGDRSQRRAWGTTAN